MLTLLALSYTTATSAARIEKPDAVPEKKEEEFDGIGIALVEKGSDCEKTTRKGDLIRITFNGTIMDSTG